MPSMQRHRDGRAFVLAYRTWTGAFPRGLSALPWKGICEGRLRAER